MPGLKFVLEDVNLLSQVNAPGLRLLDLALILVALYVFPLLISLVIMVCSAEAGHVSSMLSVIVT
jgi:hypothetical protein